MKRALVFCALVACSSDHTTVVTIQPDAGADAGPVDSGGVTTAPAGCIRGTGQSTSMTVGHAGADMTLDGLILHFEPDAIATDTKITITSSVGCPGDTTLAAETPLYEITPAGLAPSIPASVSITYGGGSHGVMLFATTPQGDLGYLATSTERNEVHGSLAQLGAVWVADYPAVAAFNAVMVPAQGDSGTHATLLLGSDSDFSKTDCTVDQGVGAVTWNFVFDATKQDYFPRSAIDVTTPATYTVNCPTAKLTANAILTTRATPELTFTAAAGQLTWNSPGAAKCVLDGANVAASGTQAGAAGVHTLICYDPNGVRTSRWVKI